MANRIILCAQCEKPFQVTDAEIELMESKGFSLPRRCPECRRKKCKAANKADDSRFEEKKKRHKRKSLEPDDWC
ncbi:MAG TPA: hypothetical protein ENN79_15885 [Desulfobacteraceae bacterium]|nr:hypothetical protein [Desulfobacteraceae bacterium]